MKPTIAMAAAGLLLASVLPAAAEDDAACRHAAEGPRLSVQQITEKVTGMGYQVRAVEQDDGCFEVKATDANGARVEFKLHPVTGETVRREHKS